MNYLKIKKVSRYVLWLLNAALILIPVVSVATYLNPKFFALFGVESFHVSSAHGVVYAQDVTHHSLTLSLAILGDLISIAALWLSLFFVKHIFKNYQQGKIFIAKNARYFSKIGGLFILDALLLQPIAAALFGLAATILNPPGQRALSLEFGSDNLESIILGVVVIVISWVMLEASRMNDEYQHTV